MSFCGKIILKMGHVLPQRYKRHLHNIINMPEFGNAPITNLAWQKWNEFPVVFADETVVAVQIDNDGFATVEK